MQRFLAACLIVCLLFCAACSGASKYDDYQDLYMDLISFTAGPKDAEFANLPEKLRAMYIAAILDMEIQCGGISAFFVNEGEEAAVLAADSLRVIGLEDMAQLYEDFLFEHGIDPADLSDFHCETTEDLTRMYSEYAFLNEFDQAYMKLWSELDFEEHMLELVR